MAIGEAHLLNHGFEFRGRLPENLNNPMSQEQKIYEFFLKQKAIELGKNGYIEIADVFFVGIFEHCKRVHPKARAIRGVGPDCIQQIIFLPRFRRSLIVKLKRELRDYKKATASTKQVLDLI